MATLGNRSSEVVARIPMIAAMFRSFGVEEILKAEKSAQLEHTLRELQSERDALKRNEERLSNDENGIVECNDSAVAMLRCTNKKQLLHVHPSQFGPEFQPDGRRSAEKRLENVFAGIGLRLSS
jgi:hypothetical protein